MDTSLEFKRKQLASLESAHPDPAARSAVCAAAIARLRAVIDPQPSPAEAANDTLRQRVAELEAENAILRARLAV